MGTITVVSGIQKRRRFSTSQKIAMVEEAMQPRMSVSYVARKYDGHPKFFREPRTKKSAEAPVLSHQQKLPINSCVHDENAIR
jgi:transposase-like protein